MDENERIAKIAIEFARKNKKRIAKDLTDPEKFPIEANPVAVFMAGSPGAGKTEASQRLIERFSPQNGGVIRIDSDELRSYMEDYNGTNSSLFQFATSIIADKIQDTAIDQHQSYVFDGTLTNKARAFENITRCLEHGFAVYILYVYQDPVQAWSFVKARELRDGRVVPREVFIEQYFLARESVNELKREFGSKIEVHLIVKNLDGTDFRYKDNISQIDSHVPEAYTRDTLEKLIV
ncbi:MAG: zeta toxin family protein [Candidatus Paceibacterota bacterium]